MERILNKISNTIIAISAMTLLTGCSEHKADRQLHSCKNDQTLVIDDFEQTGSSDKWKGTLAVSRSYSAHGRQCGELNASADQPQWLEITQMPKNWSGFEYLRFDIFNPSQRLCFGTLQIYDESGSDEQTEFKGQSYFGEGKLFLNTGWNHFQFMIKAAMVEEGNRHLDLSSIRKMRLIFGVNDHPLYIDNIRLTPKSESGETESIINPEDCSVLIDNRNIYLFLSGPADKIKTSPEITALRVRANQAVDDLENQLRIAEMQGFQTLYQRIPLITADVGLGIRSKLVWFQNDTEQKKILDYVLQSCTKASDEISRVLSSRQGDIPTLEPENEVSKASFYVKPYPPLNDLKPADGVYRDKAGNPVILLSMLQIDGGPLMNYFAPFNHRLESYTVGGGSRYTIESSPVYEAFHKYQGTHRVGWDGWCGHLIKDRWSMGGPKEDVVICLENSHIREAVQQYIRLHQSEWADNPDLLYNIMAYELQYICYCEKSQQMFRDWLKSGYRSINALNKTWQTSYASFDDIKAPETKNARPLDNINRATWYDWAEFNAGRFTDYLHWIKTEMRKYDKQTPICAGGTSSMLASSNSVTGIDEELIINKIDDVILNESGGSVIFSDLLLSLSDNRKVMVDPEMGGGTHGLLLQFLHGKSDIAKWWWAGMPSKEYPQMNETSIPHSKEISLADIAEVLRTGLDVRRLAGEITEFTKAAPEVAILYSCSSIVQVPPQQVQEGATPYLKALYSVWEGSRYLGCRIGFVSERQIMKNHFDGIKILLIPAVKYSKPEIFDELKHFVENGGIALIIPESFLFDQYARENDLLTGLGLKIESVTLPPVVGEGEKIKNYDQSFSQSIVYGEVHRKIDCNRTDIFANSPGPVSLRSDGLVQDIDPGQNQVLGKFDNGAPAIVLVKIGKGRIYYLAAPLATSDYHRILTPLATEAGLKRPVLGVGADGNPVTGAEIRSVERTNDYLVYASNLTSDTVKFDLKGNFRKDSAIDLRSMKELSSIHVLLTPYQETILKVDKENSEEQGSDK